MILSTETLNVEPIASSTQENASEKPHIASEKISEKSSEYTETERLNVNLDDPNEVDSGYKEIDIEENELKTKTQLPQPNIVESIQFEREGSEDGNV